MLKIKMKKGAMIVSQEAVKNSNSSTVAPGPKVEFRGITSCVS